MNEGKEPKPLWQGRGIFVELDDSESSKMGNVPSFGISQSKPLMHTEEAIKIQQEHHARVGDPNHHCAMCPVRETFTWPPDEENN